MTTGTGTGGILPGHVFDDRREGRPRRVVVVRAVYGEDDGDTARTRQDRRSTGPRTPLTARMELI
jgi:hypothetical protein